MSAVQIEPQGYPPHINLFKMGKMNPHDPNEST